jgi:uncharacterized protein
MSQIELIKQMQTPEFYPHPVTLPIEVVQTHVSTVFLTGDYAYKLKKIVNFGFLDYSTLEKRNHFLQEELRMNKDISPSLYLEIMPISQKGKDFSLNCDDETVEYTLKMRQFPQENLFINRFEAGKLTEKDMESLGKLVADFHQKQTITNDYIKSFGTVAKIGESITENYQQTEKYITLAQTQQHYEETKAFTDSFLSQNQELFQQRQNQDKIRECHGDLHLKNICLWEDKIQLFDRIEFNEPFRFVDVMYDVAFAVMDLDARGKQDFGNVFLNTYMENTGDWEGLQVLPLYLSRQAYVRAKVTSFLLDDPAIPQNQKDEAQKSASDYYNLAWQYTRRNQGKLILMSGLSGSGKSTLAKDLAKKLNGIQIRSDAVRKHLGGISLEEKGDNNIYSLDMTIKTYNRLLELAKLLTAQGFTVILDGKYDRVSLRQPVIEYATQNNLDLEIIYCDAPLDILSDRLEKRKGDISDATANLLGQQKANFEDFTEAEKSYLKIINTTDK